MLGEFLIVREPPPGPPATCVEDASGTLPATLYRLKKTPADLLFSRIERDPANGIVYVIYTSSANPSVEALKVTLHRYFKLPDPLILRPEVVVTHAPYLPGPGVALSTGNQLVAYWHGASGRYVLEVDPGVTGTTLIDAAALLEPFVDQPAPPASGKGPASGVSSRTTNAAALAAGVVLLFAGAIVAVTAAKSR